MAFRSLTSEEISALRAQNCRADDWAKINVAAGFTPKEIFSTCFHGRCCLGSFAAPGSGLEHADLTDCDIMDDAQVRDSRIRNYSIGERASIIGVFDLHQDSLSAFGNGERIAVLLETGGREVVMHEELTAPLAWIEIFASHQSELSLRWKALAEKVAAARQSQRGIVGAGAAVSNCGVIDSVRIGAGAVISGAREIVNATVNGRVGAGAVIRNTIIAANGEVGALCLTDHCFIADGARLDNGFQATNSLFFANCDCQRGEASSVFAAPYTVTHHQSSLLVAALYSFFNAGSGTNFSNHRYKLGPRHQGILERGCKCGSGSYLMWPSHIGAFTTVIGHHAQTLDTSVFPFSLLLEQHGKSILLPGANIFTIGFARDQRKWPERDSRADKTADLLHFSGLSPWTAACIEKALNLLSMFKNIKGNITYQGVEIPAAYIDKAQARYHAALNFYYGSVVAQSLQAGRRPPDNFAPGNGSWLDLCGMYATVEDIKKLLVRFADGQFATYAELRQALQKIYDGFPEKEWAWVMRQLTLSQNDANAAIRGALINWQAAARIRAELLRRDTDKEFAPDMRIGYGLFDIIEKDRDYLQINGGLQEDTVKSITAEAEQISQLAEKLLAGMKK